MNDELQVGVITQTHGIRGEVKVFPTTDDANRFKKLKEVTLDTGRERIPMEIENVKFFKQFVILKFKGYDSINDVEKYKQGKLLVTRDKAVELQKDEYFVADLIGSLVVTDEGEPFGTLKDVLATGANDVYVVDRQDGTEALLGREKNYRAYYGRVIIVWQTGVIGTESCREERIPWLHFIF